MPAFAKLTRPAERIADLTAADVVLFPSGGDDAPAFQAAASVFADFSAQGYFTSSTTAKRGKIVIAGMLKLGSPVTINAHCVTIEGVNRNTCGWAPLNSSMANSTLVRVTSNLANSNYDPLVPSTWTHYPYGPAGAPVVSNITITNNGVTKTGGAGIDLACSGPGGLWNCVIENQNYGLASFGGGQDGDPTANNGNTCQNVYIRNCGVGVFMDGGPAMHMGGNIIMDNCGTGFYHAGRDACQMFRMQAINCSTGFMHAPSGGGYSGLQGQAARYTQCTAVNCNIGFRMYDAAGAIHLIGCQSIGSSTNSGTSAYPNGCGFLVDGLDVSTTRPTGIHLNHCVAVGANFAGVYIDGGAELAINNCLIGRNGPIGGGSGYGIYFSDPFIHAAATRVNILGNTIINTESFGYNVGSINSRVQGTALRMSGAETAALVRHNRLTNSSNAGLNSGNNTGNLVG